MGAFIGSSRLPRPCVLGVLACTTGVSIMGRILRPIGRRILPINSILVRLRLRQVFRQRGAELFRLVNVRAVP